MEDLIAIGKVRRPHGLSGAFKVLSFSGQYDHFAQPKIYHLKKDGRSRSFPVEWVKVSGEMTLVKLKGLETPEAVKAFSNSEIWVEKHFASPLQHSQEYYYADLIGLKVICHGDVKGEVSAVFQDLIDDTLEVSLLVDRKKVLIPFRDLFVGQIDLQGKTIEILEEWFFQ